jgi:hypothetical protein
MYLRKSREAWKTPAKKVAVKASCRYKWAGYHHQRRDGHRLDSKVM